MYHVKLNSQKKLVLFNTNEQKTNEYENIIRISTSYFVLINNNEFSLNYYFYNTKLQSITHEFLNTSISNFNNGYFTVIIDDYFNVFCVESLNLLHKHKVGKSRYNFNYLKGGYVISDDCIQTQDCNFGKIDDQELIYSNGHKKLYRFNNHLLWDKAILIQEIPSHTIDQVFDNYPKRNLIIFYSEQKTSIYLDSELVFCGKITFHNFNLGGQMIYAFEGDGKSYLIDERLFGPFEQKVNYSINYIYKNLKKVVYLFNDNLFIHDKENQQFIIKNIKYDDFKLVPKSLLNIKEEELFLISSHDKLYFFNNISNNLDEIDLNNSLTPICINNQFIYLNKDYKHDIINFKNEELELVDYTYFRNCIFSIFKKSDEYYFYNMTNCELIKKFKKKINFTYHFNCIIEVEPVSGKKIELNTISDDLKSIVKVNLKADSTEKNQKSGIVTFDFDTNMAMPKIEVTSDDLFYISN